MTIRAALISCVLATGGILVPSVPATADSGTQTPPGAASEPDSEMLRQGKDLDRRLTEQLEKVEP